MKRKLHIAAAGLCLLVAVSACGQKGALYLPDAKSQAVGATPANPTADAAARRKAQQAPTPPTNP